MAKYFRAGASSLAAVVNGKAASVSPAYQHTHTQSPLVIRVHLSSAQTSSITIDRVLKDVLKKAIEYEGSVLVKERRPWISSRSIQVMSFFSLSYAVFESGLKVSSFVVSVKTEGWEKAINAAKDKFSWTSNISLTEELKKTCAAIVARGEKDSEIVEQLKAVKQQTRSWYSVVVNWFCPAKEKAKEKAKEEAKEKAKEKAKEEGNAKEKAKEEAKEKSKEEAKEKAKEEEGKEKGKEKQA